MTSFFPVLFSLGVLAGLLWLALFEPFGKVREAEVPSVQLSSAVLINAGLAALTGGILISRAVFVTAHWSHYSQHFQEIWWFWQGGLSWIGGVIGALAGLELYAWRAKRPFWAMADRLAMPAAIISLAGWIGCLLDGCAYGRSANAGWLTPPSPDILGNMAARWPTQSLGALSSLGIFGLLVMLRDRFRPGGLACLSIALISTVSLSLSFARADPTGLLGGMRYDTIGALAVLLPALAGFGLRTLKPRL